MSVCVLYLITVSMVTTGFARLVASVYSSTLLASFMSVQLSILGGSMLQDSHHKQSTELTEDAHKSYLAMVEHLLNEGRHSDCVCVCVCVMCVCVGIVGLSEAVCRAADTVLAPYSLKEGVTCQGLEQLLTDVQHSTASLGGRYVCTSSGGHYLTVCVCLGLGGASWYSLLYPRRVLSLR